MSESLIMESGLHPVLNCATGNSHSSDVYKIYGNLVTIATTASDNKAEYGSYNGGSLNIYLRSTNKGYIFLLDKISNI